MSDTFPDLVASLSATRTLTAEDTLAMRRAVWSDGTITADEADGIMALNAACDRRSREWIDFFVEVMVDYVVRQQEPAGYVDDAKAAWLMAAIDRDGRVDSLSELELIVHLMEVADSVPESFRTYALRQVETAVMVGDGPTRSGRLEAGCINAIEVELLRRMIFANGGDGAYVVSTAEADMLFRLKDATLGADNAPSWRDLFVKAAGNHLMAHRNYETLSREDQSQLNRYEADTRINIGRFFGRMVGRGRPELSPAALAISDEMNDDAAAAVDRAITPAEAKWLRDRVDGDGKVDAMEQALYDFVSAESGQKVA